MHKIFLTGEIGVGKSRVVNAVTDKHGFYGFRTYFDTERRTLFVKFSTGENFPVGYRDNGEMKPVLFGFDRAACIIEQLQPEDRLLTVDEIGFIEGDCYKFKVAFRKLLDRAENVLCVLRFSEVPFIRHLKHRSDFEVFELDKENGDEMLKLVMDRFELEETAKNKSE